MQYVNAYAGIRSCNTAFVRPRDDILVSNTPAYQQCPCEASPLVRSLLGFLRATTCHKSSIFSHYHRHSYEGVLALYSLMAFPELRSQWSLAVHAADAKLQIKPSSPQGTTLSARLISRNWVSSSQNVFRRSTSPSPAFKSVSPTQPPSEQAAYQSESLPPSPESSSGSYGMSES